MLIFHLCILFGELSKYFTNFWLNGFLTTEETSHLSDIVNIVSKNVAYPLIILECLYNKRGVPGVKTPYFQCREYRFDHPGQRIKILMLH